MPDPVRSAALPRFVLLYAAMYAAFGVASSFRPPIGSEHGLTAAQIGLVFFAAAAMSFLTPLLAGRVGDSMRALHSVLSLCAALAAFATLGYLATQVFWTFVAVRVLHAASLAPLTALADALALGSARKPGGFEYGWVRGAGAAAFVAGSLLSDWAADALGPDAVLWLQAALLGAAALVAAGVPEPARAADGAPATAALAPAGGFLTLLRLPAFRYLLLAAALVLGSNATYDSFAVTRWDAAGIGPDTASWLWREAAAAEVLVFVLVGPALLARLTPAGAIALAALAGVLRWAVMAQSSDLLALALVQPLHGLTFALLHLACMRLIVGMVPQGLEGTALALYGTCVGFGSGLIAAVLGTFSANLDAQPFWAMAALCALALPLARKLRIR